MKHACCMHAQFRRAVPEISLKSLLSDDFARLEFHLEFQPPSRGSNYHKKYSYSDLDLLKTLDKRHLQLQPHVADRQSVIRSLVCLVVEWNIHQPEYSLYD